MSSIKEVDLWIIFREPSEDTACSCPFTHVAPNRGLTVADVFALTRKTRFGLAECAGGRGGQIKKQCLVAI